LPLFLLGSISFGITTATEAGVIGVLYALLLGGPIYREYRLSDLYSIITGAAINTAIPCFLVATASLSAWIIAIERIPDQVVQFLGIFSSSPILVLILINLFLLMIGMTMDLVPALILFAPILLPIAIKAGVSPIQFGVVMVANLGIGLVTPPVGNCLFLACTLAKVPLPKMVPRCLPFLIVNLIVLALITYWPAVTMYIPSLFYK
jgi:C4-dicarboxylate transporter DctM subunit